MKIVTREEAIDKGLKTYYTGEACKRDHVCERYTLNSVCVMCNAESNKNRLIINQKCKEWVERNRPLVFDRILNKVIRG